MKLLYILFFLIVGARKSHCDEPEDISGLIKNLLPSFLLPLITSSSTSENEISTRQNPILKIKDGYLRGFTMATISSRSVTAFRNIPFAEPPIGQFRFKDPVKNQPWNGVRDAIERAPICVQFDVEKFGAIYGKEDCLYLNVYVPRKHFFEFGETKKLLPVMVWIHGGGNFFGSGSIYGPRYLLDQDVVFVTFNYRLGPLGFMSSQDDTLPGNMGMKDQVLALKWVQENIASFGGDRNSVTIFGQSAGAANVHFHMMSPMSRGLFHRAISMSGTAFIPIIRVANAREIFLRVADIFSCKGGSEKILKCLKNVKAELLVATQLGFAQFSLFPFPLFSTVIEHNHTQAFLAETPEQAYINGNVAPVPWITGVVKEELAWFVSALVQEPYHVTSINRAWNRVGPILLFLQSNHSIFVSKNNADLIANRLREFYMGGEKFKWKTRREFAHMWGDQALYMPTNRALRFHSLYTGAPTYAYNFTFEGKYSVVQTYWANPDDYGVAHLDDLLYLMNNTHYYGTIERQDSAEWEMSRMSCGIWANFARYGVPLINGPGGPENIWEPIPRQTSTNFTEPLPFLEINLKPRMIEDPSVYRYALWDELEALESS